jgi:YfiH family protein
MLTIGPLNDLPGLRHGFLTRQGGVSEGLYSSLNCGQGSGDDPAKVAENRRRALARLELDGAHLVTAYQVHSAKAVVVERPWTQDDRPQVDGLVTRVTGLALGVLTADCVPVLLADSQAGVVGAAHAGWHGALDGVLESTVEAMESLGAAREHMVAGIGPAIAQRSYEVGPDYPAPFLAQDDDNRDLFCPSRRQGHFHFDLKGYVARRLARLGLGSVQVLPCDTCAEDQRFFSYRRSCLRGEADYGRGLSVICLEPGA